jgi:hypothetical protein
LGAGGDWELPERALGAERFQLIEVCEREVILTVPPGAEVFVAGSAGRPFRAEPIHRLVAGARARVGFDGFGIELDVTSRRRDVMPLRLPTAGAMPHHVLSAAAHVTVLALLSAWAPGLGADEGTDTEHYRQRLTVLTEYGGGDGGRSPGPTTSTLHEQAIVDTTVPVTPAPFRRARNERRGSRKTLSFPSAVPPGDEATSLAEVLGARLAPTAGRSPSPWTNRERDEGGAVESLGNWDKDGGFWGLRLSGIGEGGGGRGEGIGIGDFGALGHGSGVSYGSGQAGESGRIRGSHTVGSPQILGCGGVLIGCVVTDGRLPPETIQRIVEGAFGRFRLCYLDRLRGNPKLLGRVTTRFLIARDGSVSSALDDGSDLPDDSVVSCVVHTFEALSFPEPAGGTVTVVYPLRFSSV